MTGRTQGVSDDVRKGAREKAASKIKKREEANRAAFLNSAPQATY